MQARPRLAASLMASIVILILVACGGAGPAASPTPAVAPVVSTPFPAYAAAAPPAQLRDRPGGQPGPTLPRGADLLVETVVVADDGQLWYRVSTPDGLTGWLPAASISLVDDQTLPTPTALPSLPTPTPRPATATPAASALVVTGSGQGLFLRVEPGQGDIIRAYPDGTRVMPLGAETRLEGRRWLRVRTPDGREGWMAADYLRPAAGQ